MKRATAIAIAAFCLLLTGGGSALANPIADENALRGDSAWQTALEHNANGAIAGYTSQASLFPGQTLAFHVNSANRYRIEIDRLGWYGGAGGRRVACLPSCSGDRGPATQPAPPPPNQATGELDAGWSVTDSITVPSTWVSGYYLAEFVITSGSGAGTADWYPFIVSNLPGTRTDIVAVAPVNTWQAYNPWGGKSLYGFDSTNGQAATMVSFNRPLESDNTPVFGWEYQMIRFLERGGYNVSYTSDVDVERYGTLVLNAPLTMVLGHSEYWSKGERDAFEAVRAAGRNLAFMGGNIGPWQARYADGGRTLIEYRSAKADPDPNAAEKTDLFDNLSRPVCTLTGVVQQGTFNPSQGSGDYTIQAAAASDPWMAGTGLTAGQALSSLVGYEWDGIRPGCLSYPETDFFHWSGTNSNGDSSVADATRYAAPSGSVVFAAGSLQFTWALDSYRDPGLGVTAPTNAGVQKFVTNALAALIHVAAPPCAGGYAACVKGEPGLLGYWRLGEKRGGGAIPDGTPAADETGHYPGTYHGIVAGGEPGAPRFDSDTAIVTDPGEIGAGYVSVPGLSVSAGDFTVEGWANLAALVSRSADSEMLFGASGHERLTIRPTGVYGDVFPGGTKYAVQATTASNTQGWHFFALVRSGSTLTLYRDGSAVRTATGVPTAPISLAGSIGRDTNGSYPLDGAIDEVAVFNQALSQAQILQQYSIATGS